MCVLTNYRVYHIYIRPCFQDNIHLQILSKLDKIITSNYIPYTERQHAFAINVFRLIETKKSLNEIIVKWQFNAKNDKFYILQNIAVFLQVSYI